MKKILITICIIFTSMLASAQQKFSLVGKIKTNKDVMLKLTDVSGNTIFQQGLSGDAIIKMTPFKITPDIYQLVIGNVSQYIFLTNNPMEINGYFDANNEKNIELDFKGIESHFEFEKLKTSYNKLNKPIDAVVNGLQNKLNPYMISALGYMYPPGIYEDSKALLSLIPIELEKSPSYQWLKSNADSLQKYAIGAPAPIFNFENEKGELIKLQDFRGKYVLLDFWASWCGPCRAELKNLKRIYKEFEGQPIEFISLSVDDDEKSWRKALDEEQIPWITLWDKSGFRKSKLKEDYGFGAIPFIVLIDPDGNVQARKIRGNNIKNVIQQLIEKK